MRGRRKILDGSSVDGSFTGDSGLMIAKRLSMVSEYLLGRRMLNLRYRVLRSSARMTSSETTSFESLLDKTRRELISQVEVELPSLLKENFVQSIKFLRSSATCHKLVAYWLQVQSFK